MKNDDYAPVLGDADENALHGMEVTLKAVDLLLQTLLDQIHASAEALRRRGTPDSLGGGMGAAMGSAMRLAVQKQTIEELRESIPQVILYGNPAPAARIIQVIQ